MKPTNDGKSRGFAVASLEATARAGGSPSLLSKLKEHPGIEVRVLQKIGPLTIWMVKGKIIRDHVFIDFTEGGNSEAYGWMPRDEIWLDTSVDRSEIKFVKLHEMHELNEMTINHLGYEKAHDPANKTELAARRDPSKYAGLWKKEMEPYKARLEQHKGKDDRVGKPK